MKQGTRYSIVIRDKDGKVLKRLSAPSKSFLKRWNEALYMYFAQVSPRNVKNTAGASPETATSVPIFTMDAPIADDDWGIVIGTGDTAVDVDDYALETIIAEGVGAGQMSYAACSVSLAAVAGDNCDYIVSRAITNDSGDTITVKESGIYFKLWTSGGAPYYCGIRDVFETPLELPNGGSVSVNYTIRITV